MSTATRRSVLAGAASLTFASRAFAQSYPQAPDHAHCAVGTRRLDRYPGAHRRRTSAPVLRPAVIIENRTGASGNIARSRRRVARPMAHTILFNTMSVHTMNHALLRTMPFDGVKDFSPISLLAYVTNTMVVHPSVPANNVAEFIAYAKANPGKIAYASSGPGSTNHLCAALLERMAGIEMLHVPYRGGAPAVVDTVAGQVAALLHGRHAEPRARQAGKLKLLAITEEKRSSLLPGVPTVGETVPGYEMTVWYGAFLVGRGAEGDRDTAQRRDRPHPLSAGSQNRMADIAVEVASSTPDELGARMRTDTDKWGAVIKSLGIATQ